MARTIRRKNATYEYYWVLHQWNRGFPRGIWVPYDKHSEEGRRALALFHSDCTVTMRGTAPRWYRKVSDHRIRSHNNRMLRACLCNPDFEPVFRTWHRHAANRTWW